MRLRMMWLIQMGAAMVLLAAAVLPVAAGISRETWADIQKQIQKRQGNQAIAQVETLLASPEITAADRARLLDLGSQAVLTQRPPRHDLAILWQQRIVDDETLPEQARVDAVQRIADLQILLPGGQDLHEMDLSSAMATLVQPLQWEGLSPRNRARALVNIGKLHDRQEAFEQARTYYDQAIKLVDHPRQQNDIHKLIVYSWAGQGMFDKAREIALQHDVDLIDMYRQFGRTQLQHEACMAVLEDPDATDAQRWSAFRLLPAWHVYTRDLRTIRQLSEQFLPAFTQENPDRPRQVFMPLLRRMSADEHAAFILWSAPQVIASPRCSDAEFAQLSALLVDSLAAVRAEDKLLAHAAKLAGDQRLSVDTHLWLSLVTRALEHDASAAASWLKQQKGLTPQQQSDAILKAGRTLLRAGQEQAARELHALHVELLAPIEPARLVCEYVMQAPADISQWLTWIEQKPSLASGLLDRPYGNNLQFLVDTDSANTGRTAAEQTQTINEDSRTTLHALCDDRGLHLFLLAHDSQTSQVESGKLRAGSFEMYLAPGHQQAYHTFLGDVATGGFDPQKFLTHYPTAYVHPLAREDRTFDSQTRHVAGGYASYLFLSWAAFYDKLPRQDDDWQFEAIRWTRQGGFSFGGSRSVHNRTSWGRLVFANLGKQQQQAIRRQIIPIAVARYLQAKMATSSAGNWSDPDLGDPTFHQQHVAPLFEMLDEAVRQSRETMTDAQVDALYLQAVPLWMDLEHHINNMRRDYLQQKLLEH